MQDGLVASDLLDVSYLSPAHLSSPASPDAQVFLYSVFLLLLLAFLTADVLPSLEGGAMIQLTDQAEHAEQEKESKEKEEKSKDKLTTSAHFALTSTNADAHMSNSVRRWESSFGEIPTPPPEWS